MLRDALRASARATLAAHPIRSAASVLGVSVSTLQRWQDAGVL
jgi:transposase